MKRQVKTMITAVLILLSSKMMAQDNKVQTIFKGGPGSVTGYGAASNKFSYLRGEYANIVQLYGGVFIDHKLMLGLSMEANTNNIHVPTQFSANTQKNLSYQYGQFGLMTEYIIGSNKPIHLVANLMTGAGFTLQYERPDWSQNHQYDGEIYDENWFFVLEPGIQLEVNLFKWMRFSPGVSYRASFGSEGKGMTDNDVSNISYNATLKFGRF